MPIYTYKCCGKKREVFRPMSEAGQPVLCPICGFVMKRDFFADFGKQRTADFQPIVSVAAGVNPCQIPEMQKFDAAHGLAGTQYTGEGDVVFTSRSHRKKYCRAHGLFDRNAGYSDPAPVNR